MARTNNLTNFLTDVASAIKDKKGNQADIQASNFDTEIRNLPSQGTYQEKSTTITQNGTTTIAPDSGYDAMDEVTVTTAVPLQTRNYSFTQNTTTTLTPEQGYAGFSSVGLTIDVPSGGIDTSDATAVAINIRDGETAYARGSKITGTLPVLTYPINPDRPSDTSYQFIAATASSNVTRDGTKYLMGTYQIASQSQPDSWMFEGNRKMKLGIPFSMVVSRGGIAASKIKKGETIYGVTGTYEGSGSTNIYVQSTQPSAFDGIWVQTSDTYNNIVEVANVSSLVASSINIVKGTAYETVLFYSDITNEAHYKFATVQVTDSSGNVVSGIDCYYGNGSRWIKILPYIQLQYIQSTGTQYINTNVYAKPSVDIEVSFLCTATSPNYMRIYGDQTSGTYSMWMANTTNTRWYFNGAENQNYRTINATSTYQTVKYIGSTSELYLNGTYLSTENACSDTSRNIWLFRGGDRYSNFRMKRCKLWSNGTLVRDLIPAKRVTDDVVCMYDLVNETFYTNVGSGTFVAGPNA